MIAKGRRQDDMLSAATRGSGVLVSLRSQSGGIAGLELVGIMT